MEVKISFLSTIKIPVYVGIVNTSARRKSLKMLFWLLKVGTDGLKEKELITMWMNGYNGGGMKSKRTASDELSATTED